ncbi:hypothetical protein B0T14DRAFT_293161 [Immersiella caudata]|uniref:Uncharacterized protein n=1 Tax=Immersiella caudata TaxID=314043 RepID=A0AA40BUG5_9PEZI|nr:hypothetical protein B0T14DRAFT_293161 [Immersiella caudata]
MQTNIFIFIYPRVPGRQATFILAVDLGRVFLESSIHMSSRSRAVFLLREREVAQFSKMAVPASPVSEACLRNYDWSSSYWQLRHRIKVVGRAAKDGLAVIPWRPYAQRHHSAKDDSRSGSGGYAICRLETLELGCETAKYVTRSRHPMRWVPASCRAWYSSGPIERPMSSRPDGLTRLRGTKLLEGCDPIGLNNVNDSTTSRRTSWFAFGGLSWGFCAGWLERHPEGESLSRPPLTSKSRHGKTGVETMKQKNL